MTASQAKEAFRLLTKEHFDSHIVIFAKQSRTAKPNIPLVTISPGNVRRHRAENELYNENVAEGYYLSRISLTIDLFTNGKPVYDEYGKEIGREDTAVDEMLLFENFLNSQYVTLWCNRNDVSIVIEGDTQNLTGIVNDTTYEFRSRLIVNLYFTQKTVDEKAVPPV